MAHRVDDSYPTHYVLWETEFRDGLTVEAGVDRTLDVPPIQVPHATPVTMGEVEVWIQTGLDIEWAIDPSDEDQLDVVPGPQLRGVLEAMGELGFTLQSVSNEETETSHTSAPFVQRFAYESTDGSDTSVVLTPILPTDGGNLIVRHTRPGQEERAGQVVIDSDDVEAITEQLRILLQNESA
jgi:sporulation-control protein